MMYLAMALIANGFANGGLVDSALTDAAGGVVLKQSTDVTLVSEKLTLKVLNGKHYTADALYIFNSKKAQTIQYGIPLESPEYREDLEFIKRNLTVQLNQKTYRCEKVVFDEQSKEGPSKGWCLISLDMPKGDSVPLHLTYKGELLREDSQTNKSMQVYYSPRQLNYDLFPAGYWDGNAQSIDITLDLGELAPYAKVSFEKPHKSEGNKLMWHYDDVDLKRLGTMAVEMKLDHFLEHRDMVELLKTNIHQKNTIIKASSTLTAQGKNTYATSNLLDGDLSTAWCEGVDGNGVGETLEVLIPKEKFGDPGGMLWAFVLSSGYAKNDRTWTGNGRVESVRVGVCGEEKFQRLSLKQKASPYSLQLVEAEEYHEEFRLYERIQDNMMMGEDVCLTVTIDKVSEGKHSDTCISELQFIAFWG